MAVVQGVGGDPGDGLHRAGNAHPDRVVGVEGLQHTVKDLVLGVVLHHADLLADDALLLGHALGGEPGHGDEGEEDLQVLLKLLRALEVVAGDVGGGEGVGTGTVGGQVLEGVAVLGVEHLVLQEVGHPGGGVVPGAVQLEAHVHAAVVGGEKGEALGEVRLHIHIDVEAVVQSGMPELLSDAGIFLGLHGDQSSLPLRK